MSRRTSSLIAGMMLSGTTAAINIVEATLRGSWHQSMKKRLDSKRLEGSCAKIGNLVELLSDGKRTGVLALVIGVRVSLTEKYLVLDYVADSPWKDVTGAPVAYWRAKHTIVIS